MQKVLILFFGILLFLGIFQSCDWLLEPIDSDCIGAQPNDAEMHILLTHNDLHDTTLVVIYKGEIEDANVIDSYDVWNETLDIWLPVDEYYAAKAFYTVDGQEYIAIDGSKMRASNNPDEYGDCWTISGDHLYLQIMYP